jgi:hypothetical protein
VSSSADASGTVPPNIDIGSAGRTDAGAALTGAVRAAETLSISDWLSNGFTMNPSAPARVARPSSYGFWLEVRM